MNKIYSNKIELIGFYGGDEIMATSAWTSTSRNLTEEKRNRIPALIDMLWSEGHETPAEKVMVHFLVDTDIATHIHLLKHRMASINAESARYKELKEDKFYLPEDWGDGHESYAENGMLLYWYNKLKEKSEETNKLYHQCLEDLSPIIGRKRAKESARFFKLYNSQIQADVIFNMRSFANFIKLRNSEHAQLEIRVIAQQMWDFLVNETDGKMVNILKAIDERITFENKCKKYKKLINDLE